MTKILSLATNLITEAEVIKYPQFTQIFKGYS